jgi:hypothetical protein
MPLTWGCRSGRLFGLADHGQPGKRSREGGKIADRLLDTDLRRTQLTIWAITTAVAIAQEQKRAAGCRS